MHKNIKSIFFIMLCLLLILSISSVNAVDDNSDTMTDTVTGDSTTNTITQTNTPNDNNNAKNILKDENTRTSATHIVNNDTISTIFSNTGKSTYSNNYFDTSLLGDEINAGDTLDFQGSISGNYNLTIDKAVNIISSTNDAYIDLNTTCKGLMGGSPGNSFSVNCNGSYTNITGINFRNTQLFVINASHVTLDNITCININHTMGGGVGTVSIRQDSWNITVKNSYFYTENNGLSTVFTLSGAGYSTIDNNTFSGENCGNIFYLNFFNTIATETQNQHNIITNNEIIGGGHGGVSLPVQITGSNNTFENNTALLFEGNGYNNIFKGNTAEYIGINLQNSTIVNNTLTGNTYAPANSLVENNTISGQITVYANSVVNNNIIGSGVTLNGVNANITNNTITGTISLPKTTYKNTLISRNTIEGSIEVNSQNNTITNNTISTANDYTIKLTRNKNTVIDNYLETIAKAGNQTIQTVTGNTIENNKPETNAGSIEITDETYSNYFDNNGYVNNPIITNYTTLYLNGTFNNKKFIIDNMRLAITGVNNCILNEGMIKPTNNAHIDIKNITINNENLENALVFDSDLNQAKNMIINYNTTISTNPIIINGNKINILNSIVIINSEANVDVVKINASYIQFNNNKINVNTTGNTNVITVANDLNACNSITLNDNKITVVADDVNTITFNDKSNFNTISSNTIILTANNANGLFITDTTSFTSNNINNNTINIISTNNAHGIYFKDNDEVSQNIITTNIININATGGIVLATNTALKKLNVTNNTFNVYGNTSIGMLLMGDTYILNDNFITVVGSTNTHEIDSINNTCGIIFNKTSNSQMNKTSADMDYTTNVTNGYGIKFINSTNIDVEYQVINSDLEYAVVLSDSSDNYVMNSYIKSNITGGNDAILETGTSQNNNFTQNTPNTIYLTQDNYDTYFTDGVLNYEDNETKNCYNIIILDSDIYDKNMEFRYPVKLNNLKNYTLYNTTLIMNSHINKNNEILQINRISQIEINDFKFNSTGKDYIINSNSTRVQFNSCEFNSYEEESVINGTGIRLYNSTINHQNNEKLAYTINASVYADSLTINTYGPEIENYGVPSTIAVNGSQNDLSNTVINVYYTEYDNKGTIAGIGSLNNQTEMEKYTRITNTTINVYAKENGIGSKGILTGGQYGSIYGNNVITVKGNNVIGIYDYALTENDDTGLYSSNITLNANKSAIGIYCNVTLSTNKYYYNNFNINSNDTAYFIKNTPSNSFVSQNNITINAKGAIGVNTNNSTISLTGNNMYINADNVTLMKIENSNGRIQTNNILVNASTNDTLIKLNNFTTAFTYNNITSNTTSYLIEINNSTNSQITDNYLVGASKQGPDSILITDCINTTQSRNMPQSNILTNDNYNEFFTDGILSINGDVITLGSDIYNKNMTFTKEIQLLNPNNYTIYNGTITYENASSTTTFSNLIINNTDNRKYTFVLNSPAIIQSNTIYQEGENLNVILVAHDEYNRISNNNIIVNSNNSIVLYSNSTSWNSRGLSNSNITVIGNNNTITKAYDVFSTNNNIVQSGNDTIMFQSETSIEISSSTISYKGNNTTLILGNNEFIIENNDITAEGNNISLLNGTGQVIIHSNNLLLTGDNIICYNGENVEYLGFTSNEINMKTDTPTTLLDISSEEGYMEVMENTILLNVANNGKPVININCYDTFIFFNYIEALDVAGDNAVYSTGIVENNRPADEGYISNISIISDDMLKINTENEIIINPTDAFNRTITGDLTVKINGENIPINDNIVKYTPRTFDDIIIIASYTDPTDKYNPKTVTKTIAVIPPTLTVDSINAKVGDVINITARITAGNETVTTINKGKVAFKVNGVTLKDDDNKVIYARMVSGTATIENYAISETIIKEEITIEAVYSGSSECDALRSDKFTMNITKRISTIEFLMTQTTYKSGENITLTVIVKEGSTLVSRGKVSFKLNGVTLKDENGKAIYATINNGIGQITYSAVNLPARIYNLTAVYGDKIYERAEANTTIEFIKGTTHIEVRPMKTTTNTTTITAKILDGNNQIIKTTTKVTVKINGKTFVKGEYVNNGTINFTVDTPFKVGVYDVEIIAGDSKVYSSSRTTTTLQIQKVD